MSPIFPYKRVTQHVQISLHFIFYSFDISQHKPNGREIQQKRNTLSVKMLLTERCVYMPKKCTFILKNA